MEYDSIYFNEFDLIIPLSLYGISSYFVTMKPNESDIEYTKYDVVFFTLNNPSQNPHNNVYVEDEELYLDW